jgi:hypothetical protein
VTDPFIQFAGAGFDDERVAAAFAQIRDAARQLVEAARQVWKRITELVAQTLRAIVRCLHQLGLVRVVARQYRLTMQRRKLRRAAVMGFVQLRT